MRMLVNTVGEIPLEKQQNTTEELEEIGHWLLLAKVTNVKT